ncbi:uncharacterized protein G2W53_011592 [Senna tora]|uniref:Uncharacterized protein n=1 Tax=Senna tora TaxID=362788 RepID=A0A834X211_9FABA|nr:uncharacterized protein G2W53_011592 [Senna tora]
MVDSSLLPTAMDLGDGETDVSVSSLIINSINSQQNEILSPEDLAWVDSCLVEDTDILESNWNPLKNALIEIISSTPESFNTNQGADIEILPSSEENNARFRGTGKFSPVSRAAERSMDGILDDKMTDALPSSTFQENPLPISEGNIQESNHIDLELNLDYPDCDMERSIESSTYNILPVILAAASTDDIPNNEKTETLPYVTFKGNPFLPTYSEDLKENETNGSGLNLDSSGYDMEPPSDDIFKIWDLNIPSEEGELFKQWNKVMAANSLQMVPSSFDALEESKVLRVDSLNNLIVGIADLSLNQDAS